MVLIMGINLSEAEMVHFQERQISNETELDSVKLITADVDAEEQTESVN